MKAAFSVIIRDWEYSDFLLPFIKDQKRGLFFMHRDGDKEKRAWNPGFSEMKMIFSCRTNKLKFQQRVS